MEPLMELVRALAWEGLPSASVLAPQSEPQAVSLRQDVLRRLLRRLPRRLPLQLPAAGL